MKIALIGKDGMLGSYFLKFFAGIPGNKIYAFGLGDLDITDAVAVKAVLDEVAPEFVINCAAYTDVDKAESDREGAFSVNASAPGYIAESCAKLKCGFLHFSTDYVFGGDEKGHYAEGDSPCPVNFYGESKLAGEKNVMEKTDDFYIVRTAWLYGPNGGNFVDKMIKLGKERGAVKVVDDQVGSPTYTHDLVKACHDNFIVKKQKSGIYHLVNSGEATRFDMAVKIFDFAGLGVDLKKCGSDEFPSSAKRPAYSVLKNLKLPALRPWDDALKAYISAYHK